jgi:hypothetical protein
MQPLAKLLHLLETGNHYGALCKQLQNKATNHTTVSHLFKTYLESYEQIDNHYKNDLKRNNRRTKSPGILSVTSEYFVTLLSGALAFINTSLTVIFSKCQSRPCPFFTSKVCKRTKAAAATDQTHPPEVTSWLARMKSSSAP